MSEKSPDLPTNFLESVLGALPSHVSYIDPSLTYRYVNHAYEKWFENKKSDWVGKTVRQALGEEAFKKLKPYLKRALQGETVTFPLSLTSIQGELRFFLANYVPDKGPDGRVKGIFVISNDVTEQELAKIALGKKEAELARVLNSIPALVGLWDRNLRNVHSNQAALDFYGRPIEKVKGFHLSEIFGAEGYKFHYPYIQSALAGKTEIFERELSRSVNGITHLLITYLPDVSNGVVEGFFAIGTDISAFKRMELERREMEGKLISSAKLSSLGEMAGGIAHEINNPLAIIQGRARILRDHIESGNFDAKVFINDLRKVESTVDRIAKIVRGLQSFSRDAGNDPMTVVRVSEILADVLDLSNERLKTHQIELKMESFTDVALECRSVQICQVVMNLLSNAHDAVENLPERWINLDVSATSDIARIVITDSGGGITKEVAEKMMEPFFTTKEVGRGTGLGLSVARGIIKGHCGTLLYDDTFKNTRFIVELPLKQSVLPEIQN